MMTTHLSADSTQAARRVVSYHDGLGRPVQTLRRGGAGNGDDLVDRTEYDSLCRACRSWNPVAVENNDGREVSAAMVSAFAQQYYSDNNAYTLTEYDGSPLDRIRKVTGPGEAWHNAEKGVKSNYLTNTESAGTDSLHCVNYGFTLSGDTVNYVYSADGEKLYVEENPSGGTLQGTEYAANYRIDNGTVTMIHTDAGYYTPLPTPAGTAPSYTHIWYLKDHLGNNRVLASGRGAALSRYHYDPYGVEISMAPTTPSGIFLSGMTESPYKYGGKEWSATTSTYDFEARYLSPSFHRFTTMDPLAEKYYSISPYVYCADDPVNLVDYTGMELSDYYSLKGKLLMHIDDGEDGKYFILNGSDVNTAINNGDIFPVPSGEVITKMSESFKATAKDGKERGFRVGNNGEASIIVTGSNTEITNEQWAPAVDDLRENHHTMVSYDVHTHPKDNNYSTNVPSETDKNNVVGHWPNVLLGYEHTVYSNTDFTGSTTVTHFDTPQIIFYNHTGVIGSPMDYSSFLKSVKRTNKN